MARYTLRVRIAAYALLFLAVIASLMLLLYVYIIKGTFETPVYGDTSFETVSNGSKVFSGGQMLVETDLSSFNSLAWRYLNEPSVAASLLPDGVEINGFYCVFKEIGGSDIIYSNVLGPGGITYPFKCGFSYSFGDGTADISLNNVALGEYELPIGLFFWRFFKLPERITFDSHNRQELMFLSSLDIEADGGVTLVYDYDEQLLAEKFNDILADSDERKIEFHEGKKDIEPALISYARNKSVNPQEAKSLVMSFEKSPEAFLSLCYLLNDNGIRKLCDSFGESYYKYMSADKLAETSEDAINSDLNAFNKKFSRLLLQYLYENPDYEIKDETIYVRGSAIEPEAILSEAGEESVYDIKILADSGGITVKYGISGYETEKRVIMGE